jgi:voltage-gated sodium channel
MTELTSMMKSPLQQQVATWLQKNWVQRSLLSLILINAVILGLETSPGIMAVAGAPLMWLDKLILAIFVLEIMLRIFAYRGAFFKNAWNLFDFTVVAIALIPASGPFAVMRALRVLRVLRVLTFVPSMKKIVGALVQSLNGMLSIAMVLGLVFYVSAVMATKLFGAAFPEWFGDLGKTFFTLFQIMTLDSWSSGITRPIMKEFPYAAAFFIPYILIATFVMLNLFIAVIVNAVQKMHEDEHKAEIDAKQQLQQDLVSQMQQLQAELAALRKQLPPHNKMD